MSNKQLFPCDSPLDYAYIDKRIFWGAFGAGVTRNGVFREGRFESKDCRFRVVVDINKLQCPCSSKEQCWLEVKTKLQKLPFKVIAIMNATQIIVTLIWLIH